MEPPLSPTDGNRSSLGPDLTVWHLPHLDSERRIVSGTAAGIAREVGIDPSYVRASFVVLTLAGGWGALLYLVAWVVLARNTLSSAPYTPVPKAVSPPVRIIAFIMIAAGLVVLGSMYGVSPLGALLWPIVFVGAAVAVGLDRSRWERFRLGELQNQAISYRVAAGLLLLFAGIISASFVSLSFWQAIGGTLVAGLVLLGAGIVFAPIISGLAGDLLAERRRRIRSEERADMAAHLHDSVLQTLTLIQKRSQDASVVSLARRQERELRSWLFEDQAMNPNLGFRAGLEHAMAEVEEMYHVPVEVVVVGDCQTDADVAAVLNAAREAAANAATHSGASRVDVFAEVGAGAIEVFVRDQGVGFDSDTVDEDRAGVRDSILGRMERHGGSANVHSVIGIGTEIELRLPREQAPLSDSVETF